MKSTVSPVWVSSMWSLGPPSLGTHGKGIVPRPPVLALYPQRPPPLSQTDGYSLSWLALLADIDECANSNTCGDARCKNLPGSYSCLCDKGYTYSSQEKTCQGTHAAATQVTSLTLSLGYTWVTAWMWAALL